MAEEIKLNDGQNGETQNGSAGQVKETPTRSENRYEDLVNKIKEQEGKHAIALEEKEKARLETERKLRETEFELGLTKESTKYPNAPKYKKEILSYVDKGLSVEEATKLVLVNKNELVTHQDIQRGSAETSSFGGSSDTVRISGEQDPQKMTQAERRAELEKLENSGRLGIKGGAIFAE